MNRGITLSILATAAISWRAAETFRCAHCEKGKDKFESGDVCLDQFMIKEEHKRRITAIKPLKPHRITKKIMGLEAGDLCPTAKGRTTSSLWTKGKKPWENS